MLQFITLPLSFFMAGLLSETLCSLTVEVEAGDNTTVWCQHELSVTGSIFWYKHTCGSVPLLLGCKQFFASRPSKNCELFTESERIVMSVHEKNTSLTITAVNVSDTGLYYCSFMKQVMMAFSNSTFLHVKDGNKTNKNSERIKGSVSSPVFFVLTVVFGAVTVILLSVLIFIILKHRETHRGDHADKHDDEEQEADSVNYAALQVYKRKIRKTGRHGEILDTHVVYLAIR
ncbi:uncharacterized protein LOC132872768 isoform X1 [Neoarius graeffei]|uniref:uncharacterized protein LOC132872768 isoform X1 n=1 Tax=Neoarius graeffei TaxID=443677 RepID=UPI00298CA869|nr:uncharacterized protein LOC132872768 isoform X1 [Neoarius graeffei]